ncbi:NYN domain-containing protein [Phototrophicus methaneseepsis]|nr:NYN domain-containing protein [Phototrophicus methaneseepsis]
MVNNQSTFNPERRIAMLIDGDNAQHSLLKQMFEEASRYGEVTIRRAYGDWTEPNLSNWRPVMLAHAIQPIQQWRYTTGKNATDSALIIDAMDILYSGTVQGFCVISSDSDYTRLCTRIRESGLFVMGIGREKTPEAFINACNVFVYVENLIQSDEVDIATTVKKTDEVKTPAVVKAPAKTSATAKKPAKAKPNTSQKDLLNLLRRAFDIAVQDDDGWVHLGPLGNALQRIEPSFDSRTYGFKSLSLLIKSMPKQVEVKGAKKTGASTIYARMKDVQG